MSEFTGIDWQGFMHLLPALELNLYVDDAVNRLAKQHCDMVGDEMGKRGPGRDSVLQHVVQMRYQHRNLQRRKAAFDARFGGAADQVEAFMKEHREAFSKSHQQTVFRGLDLEAGLRSGKVQARQSNRFNSMLQECYGGRRAIRTYLETGRLRDIRLPPLHRPDVRGGERRPEPKPAPNPNAAQKRAKYYDALIADMQAVDLVDQPPDTRTTRLWAPFAGTARIRETASSKHLVRAAEGIHAVLARQRHWERGVSARSRSPGRDWWGGGSSSSWRRWRE